MWTSIGAILIIIAAVGGALWWVIKIIALSFFASGDKKSTREEISEAEAEKTKLYGSGIEGAMPDDFRERVIKEDPESVIIGVKKIYIKVGMEKLDYHAYHITGKNGSGCTESLYKFLSTEVVYDHKESAIAIMVAQYVCCEGYDLFRKTFTSIVQNDISLAIKLMREIHANNRWKDENGKIYDCTNYLRQFLKENRIQELINKQAGQHVDIPNDLRMYRPNTPVEAAAQHIQHLKDCQSRIGKRAESELSNKSNMALVGIFTTIEVISLIVWFVNVSTIWGWGQLILSSIIWFIVFISADKSNAATLEYERKEREDKTYLNPIYRWAINKSGYIYWGL